MFHVCSSKTVVDNAAQAAPVGTVPGSLHNAHMGRGLEANCRTDQPFRKRLGPVGTWDCRDRKRRVPTGLLERNRNVRRNDVNKASKLPSRNDSARSGPVQLGLWVCHAFGCGSHPPGDGRCNSSLVPAPSGVPCRISVQPERKWYRTIPYRMAENRVASTQVTPTCYCTGCTLATHVRPRHNPALSLTPHSPHVPGASFTPGPSRAPSLDPSGHVQMQSSSLGPGHPAPSRAALLPCQVRWPLDVCHCCLTTLHVQGVQEPSRPSCRISIASCCRWLPPAAAAAAQAWPCGNMCGRPVSTYC